MEVIKTVINALGNALGLYFKSDMDVMSDEARKIFSNEADRKKYIEAVRKLRDNPGTRETTIELSNKEKITLVS